MALSPHPVQKLSITYFSNQCKILIQDAGIWRGRGAISTVCFGPKVIADLRDGAANCSLSSETSSGKLYHSKAASYNFWIFFLFTALANPDFINKHH